MPSCLKYIQYSLILTYAVPCNSVTLYLQPFITDELMLKGLLDIILSNPLLEQGHLKLFDQDQTAFTVIFGSTVIFNQQGLLIFFFTLLQNFSWNIDYEVTLFDGFAVSEQYILFNVSCCRTLNSGLQNGMFSCFKSMFTVINCKFSA